MDIFEPGFPKSASYTRSASPETARAWDPLETHGGLAYDTSSDTYTYVWKTAKSFADSCRVLAVKFADGSGQRAVFRFDR
jgi:hypothetical protein